MANTLGITEVTLEQAADSTDAVNAGKQWDRPQVIRITDHESNDASETGKDTDKMAIFECKAKGHPWMRRGTHLSNIRHDTVKASTDTIPKNVEVLYPDWDYATFQ